MATIDTYKLKISVEGQQAVDSLKSKVEGLNDSILAVSGATLAGLVTSSLRFADAIQDVADATGIAGGKIMALGTAMQAAGGDAKDVGKMINKFYQNLDEMSQGSDGAEEALKRVGIGFEDLRTLSAEALLEKSIANLAKMEAGAQRTAAGIAIFGKAFGAIDPKKLEEIFKTQDITKLNVELQKSADIVQAFETSFLNLQKATLTAINGIIGDTDDLTLSLEEAEKVLKGVAVAFGIAFGAKIIANLIEIGKLIVVVNNALKITALIQTALAALSGPKGWIGIAAAIVTATGALFAFNKESEKVKGLDLKDPELAVKSYNMAIAVLQKQLAQGKISLQEFQKQAEMMSKASGLPQMKAGEFPDASPVTEKEVEKQKEVAAAARLKTQEMIKQASLQNEYQRKLNNEIGQQNTLANIRRANLAIDQQYKLQILDLETQIATETEKGAEKNQDLIKALNARISALNKIKTEEKALSAETILRTDQLSRQTAELKDMNQMQFELLNIQNQGVISLNAYLNALGKVSTIRDNELIALQKNTEYHNNILSIINRIGSALETTGNVENDLTKINNLYVDLTSHAEKLKNLIREATDANDSQTIILEEQQKILEQYPELREKEGQFLLNLMALEALRHNVNMNNIWAEQDANDERQQSIILGAQDAMEQLRKSLTPYQVAQDAIQQTWNTIGSSLDTFVKEGKFKFKDFARSIIEDIGLMIAKMYLFQAIQAGAGFFGFTLPGIPGKAMGGPVGKGMPYMVGEKGPELFVPKQAGTIIPNNKLASAPAAAAPQAQPAPANNTYNTYNISAIDSQSVAQFFAQNRKMALGAVEMAKKELPYGVG